MSTQNTDGPQYDEPVKNLARKTVLEAAVSVLTKNRSSAPLVGRSYVRDVRHEISNNSAYDACKTEASLLSDSVIDRWETFHDSIVQSKTSKDLKVAFLCGPKPENDVAELISLGILEENIWAFEIHQATYDEAVLNSLNSKFPFLKIFRGGVDSFLNCSKQRFDIIYLDFCGTIAAQKKSPHRTIASVFAQNSLMQNGVLITNVSFPVEMERNKSHRNNLFELACYYLFNKDTVEGEILSENGFEYSDWQQMHVENPEHCYSLFLTRLLMDLGLVCSPTERFFNHCSNGKPIFDFKENNLLECAKLLMKTSSLDELEDAQTDDEEFWFGAAATSEGGKYALVKTFHGLLQPARIYGQENVPNGLQDLSRSFARQLSSKNDQNFASKIQALIYLLSSDHLLREFEFLPDSTRKLVEDHSSDNYQQFCDVVCQHQILELLFCQLTNPYHFNVTESKRWTYKAKDTAMFMDMAVFDQCRYVYDWMPTLDMFAFGMKDKERQLSYRFALDGIRKHAFHYNSEFLAGTHVVPVHLDGFLAKELSPRKELKLKC